MQRLLTPYFREIKRYPSAHAFLSDQEDTIDGLQLVISDLRMPGMSGIELLHRIRELGSDIPFVLVSGEMFLDSMVDERIDDDRVLIIQKPIKIDPLMAALTKFVADLGEA